MSDKIVQNLVDFFLEFKQKNFFLEEDWFYTFSGKWPNCNIAKTVTNPKINIDFNASHYVKNWILTDNFFRVNKEKIQQAKLFPVNKWTNMFLERKAPFVLKTIPDFKTEILQPNEIDAFLSVCNASFKKELLTSKQLKTALLKNNITCFAGKFKGQIVSTAIFFDNQDTIGLYFIATKEAFQKNGFASETVKNGINYYLQKEKKSFVLHAMNSGKKMYENLGFKAENKMLIFVKI